MAVYDDELDYCIAQSKYYNVNTEIQHQQQFNNNDWSDEEDEDEDLTEIDQNKDDSGGWSYTIIYIIGIFVVVHLLARR